MKFSFTCPLKLVECIATLVTTATRYRLDNSGLESWWKEVIFPSPNPSSPVLELTQSSVIWTLGFLRRDKPVGSWR